MMGQLSDEAGYIVGEGPRLIGREVWSLFVLFLVCYVSDERVECRGEHE